MARYGALSAFFPGISGRDDVVVVKPQHLRSSISGICGVRIAPHIQRCQIRKLKDSTCAFSFQQRDPASSLNADSCEKIPAEMMTNSFLVSVTS